MDRLLTTSMIAFIVGLIITVLSIIVYNYMLIAAIIISLVGFQVLLFAVMQLVVELRVRCKEITYKCPNCGVIRDVHISK